MNTEPTPSGEGDCFVVAARLVLARPTLTLCHGKPTGLGGNARGLVYWHAWCETPHGVVIDRANGRDIEMPVGTYYSLGRIDVSLVRRYTVDEMLHEMREFQHYGPWPEGVNG